MNGFATCEKPRILSGKRLVENVRVGWLYSEVHFCFPQYDAALGSASKDQLQNVFEQILGVPAGGLRRKAQGRCAHRALPQGL